MHLYFSGIGGSGISALAHMALDEGFFVSGSDQNESENLESLRNRGAQIFVGQSGKELELANQKKPVYWLIYSSSIPQNHAEITFAKENNIKLSKRDLFINFILKKNRQKLIAIAGTHGKTTTTAMLIWLFKEYNLDISYCVGSNINWGNSGKSNPKSRYFLLEADEYDKNFLNYTPHASILTSIGYDHPDTYPTKADYFMAFQDFLARNKTLVAFKEDLDKLGLEVWHDETKTSIIYLKKYFGGLLADYDIFSLAGLHNRQNAALCKRLFQELLKENVILNENEIKRKPVEKALSRFPGTQRRMEKLAENLYTDYAHHPEEIAATLEMATELNKEVVAVYQPHQNLRQHNLLKNYGNCFKNAKKVYWLPTYLTRENPELAVLKPQELIANLTYRPEIKISDFDTNLTESLNQDYKEGKLIVFMGAGSIDTFLRRNLIQVVQ
jgi:UDP-N-acetylmuramate--alanine ligase